MVSGTQTSGLTTPTFSQRNQNQQDRQVSIGNNRIWSERIELRGSSNTSPMSFNGTIQPSRSPSLASNGSLSNIPRVHGHDHTRPLPPPRLIDTTPIISTIAPLTAPLTPLSTSSSFRSRITPITTTNSLNDNSILSSSSSSATTPTTTSSLSRINNNNNNTNNNNNSSNSNSSNSNSNNNNNSSRTTVGEVTLTVPRPDGERVVNEYVETPFRQPTPSTNQKCPKNDRRLHHHNNNNHHHHHQLQQLQNQHHQQQQQNLQRQQQQLQQQQLQQQQQTSNDKRIKNTTRRNQILLQSSSLSSSQPVTKQPVSFTKEPSNTLGSSSINGLRFNDPSLSIMCDYCGKCKCESCREAPPLPSRWLCDNSCFCSAETALDYASCLCCVKGLFYHCADAGIGGGGNSGSSSANNNINDNGDIEVDGSCADEPCSCSGSRKTTRWACLAALTMVLPCLLCYWPLKGCVTLCETCYAKHAAQGCRCDPSIRHQGVGSGGGGNSSLLVSQDSRDTEKRLLDPVTPEL